MRQILAFGVALLSCATAQQINFSPTTGTRSLWIPFKTLSGVPRASVMGSDDNNRTTYVVSCPTGQPQCALAPSLTVTEGTDMVRWVSSTDGASSGTVEISCPSLTAAPVTCFQLAHGGGNIAKTSGTVPARAIVYSAVDVTALKGKKKGKKNEVTTEDGEDREATPTSTSMASSTSTGGVETITSGPMAMFGAVGVGILAVAAL